MNRLRAGMIVTLLTLTTLIAQAAAKFPTDSLVIRFANRTRLVIYAPDKAGIQALANYDLNKIVREMGMRLDSVPGGKTAISRDGEEFLKDTVLVVTKKKDGVTIVINDKQNPDSTQNRQAYERSRRKNRRNDWNTDFSISIGLNNFIQRTPSAAYPDGSYSLRPIGSRYIALGAGASPTIIRGKRASMQLYYGVEMAWNNFMFEGNIIAEKTANGVAFIDAGRPLQKSKLTVCTIGIPVVPRVTFYNSSGRKTCYVGVGGYINYRLDSYRKIKEADGGKDRRHSNFDLNDFRYGVMGHIGVRGANFFVKYDLNPLFMTGRGPDLRVLSFGIGL